MVPPEKDSPTAPGAIPSVGTLKVPVPLCTTTISLAFPLAVAARLICEVLTAVAVKVAGLAGETQFR
jgi:hypothetical protein